MKKCLFSLVKFPCNKTFSYRAYRTFLSSTVGKRIPSDTKVNVEEYDLKPENVDVGKQRESDIEKSKPFPHKENKEFREVKIAQQRPSPRELKDQINNTKECSMQEENREYGLDTCFDFSEEAQIRIEDFIGKFAQTKKYRGNEIEEIPGSEQPKLNYIFRETCPDYKKVHDECYKEFNTTSDMAQLLPNAKEFVHQRILYPDERLSDTMKKEVKIYIKDFKIESDEWEIDIERDVVTEVLEEQIPSRRIESETHKQKPYIRS